MREDNSDKRMFYKYIFLLAVTLLIGLVYLWKWTADNPKEQAPEEMFQQEEEVESSNKPNGLDKEKIDQVLTEEENDNDEVKEEETQRKHDNEDESLGKSYIQKHGEKEIEQAKEQAKTVLALYLLQVTDWEKWDGTVTDNYLKNVQKEMSHSTQESVKRELDKIEFFASQPQGNTTITYGAFASWYVTVNGKSTSKPMQLYYITLEKEGDTWVVSDMVTPEQQHMEGERKERK
ncbi:hypothetical protein KQI49_09130 [Virgibacillus sp. MSJ-26]|uniref:hypothetical protein n=1 Tax=Virgibacillus sp. MSJ-26 TaxID=2841522 RepID=UPI001C0F470F|nr:hypothetical protein [Virgibacillus sp. MSJ-26]MBU5466983.1 hypothetical protein [Virgibacillus sp. MSJ-26]